MRRFIGVLLVTLLVLSVAAIGRAGAPLRLPREETLYKAGEHWGPTTNWNPFVTANAWPTDDDYSLYEGLFGYSFLTGKLEPFLGKSCEWMATWSE